jgi:arylsulfatase A-like enzyme
MRASFLSLPLLVCALAGCRSVAPAAQRPDILVILADDLGWSDIGCYGGEIETPNLDRLAAEGLRFTAFTNTGRCCPTRASLLTGRYAHQVGMGWMTAADLGRPAYRGELSSESVTLAEALRAAGYATAMCGKWHLTYQGHLREARESWPTGRGFERWFGTLAGSGSYFAPSELVRDGELVEAVPEGFYLTDAISDTAVRFIAEHHESAPEQPLFLYVAHNAPHWPLHALPEDIARYESRYADGWDALRAARHRRQIELGLLPAWLPLPERDADVPAWDSLEPGQRAEMARRMAVYAAQVDRLDQGVGRILAELERTGRLANTLILFLSDNGGCAEAISRGERDPALIGSAASFESYRRPWAHLSNTPLRLYKHWVHQGGIATPLIVHWPAGFAARGELRAEPGHVIDVLPTCLEAARAGLPPLPDGRQAPPLEGTSLVPVLAGRALEPRTLCWEHEGNRAVRVANWKLVSRDPDSPWELYDLSSDPAETRDLAAREPLVYASLASRWNAWARRCDVLPLDTRGWNERLQADPAR